MRTDDIDNSRIIVDVHIPSEVTSDILDELVKSNTPALEEIHVREESIIGVQDTLLESSIPSHDIRCPPSKPTIKKEIEHDIVATSIDTSESLWFLPIFVMLLLMFLFYDYLEFFLEFFQSVLVILYH